MMKRQLDVDGMAHAEDCVWPANISSSTLLIQQPPCSSLSWLCIVFKNRTHIPIKPLAIIPTTGWCNGWKQRHRGLLLLIVYAICGFPTWWSLTLGIMISHSALEWERERDRWWERGQKTSDQVWSKSSYRKAEIKFQRIGKSAGEKWGLNWEVCRYPDRCPYIRRFICYLYFLYSTPLHINYRFYI